MLLVEVVVVVLSVNTVVLLGLLCLQVHRLCAKWWDQSHTYTVDGATYSRGVMDPVLLRTAEKEHDSWKKKQWESTILRRQADADEEADTND